MSFALSTVDQALQFRFDGTDRLYTDHEGRRVIVDVEGHGEMRLLHAEPDVLIVREGEPPKLFSALFEDGSIVLAKSPGLVEIQVGLPCIPDLGERRTQTVDLPYRGCGWVVAGPPGLIADDKHEASPIASREFPIPFLMGLEGKGTASIVAAEDRECRLVDSFDVTDSHMLAADRFKVRNMSAVEELDSAFSDGTRRVAGVACHLNAAEFEIQIPAENCGLRLRKIYDRFHGRQRARVIVDGEFVGWWYQPGEDRRNRWHVSDFGIPESTTKGKGFVHLSIDPPAGVALWSMSRMEIYALCPQMPAA